MMDTTQIALIGLPAAGKTSYLAALYNALEDAPPGAPRLRRLPSNRSYLEGIRDAWLAGTPVDHTAVGTGELIELDVVMEEGVELTLRIPDVSGESFTEALALRTVDAALAHVVRESSGVLLFTHPSLLQPRISITQALDEGFVEEGESRLPLRDFDPAQAPTETLLVDLLQWVTHCRQTDDRLRVSLVLSAWDELRGVSPHQWLAQLPLLVQYLLNHKCIDGRAFGVSAQGGTYGGADNPVTTPPAERPYVVTGQGSRRGDITLPLRWAAGWVM